jgi:Zn-dependent oligopeptidase
MTQGDERAELCLPGFGVDLGPELRTNGQRLRDALLFRGAVVDPIAALRSIIGREHSVEPLLARRGLLR